MQGSSPARRGLSYVRDTRPVVPSRWQLFPCLYVCTIEVMSCQDAMHSVIRMVRNTYCTENNTLLARTHDPASARYTLSSPAVRLPVARTLLKSDSTSTSILGGPGNLR